MTIASLAFSTALLLNPIPQQDAPTQTADLLPQASPTSEFMVVAHNDARHGRHFHPGKQGGYWGRIDTVPGYDPYYQGGRPYDPRHLNFRADPSYPVIIIAPLRDGYGYDHDHRYHHHRGSDIFIPHN